MTILVSFTLQIVAVGILVLIPLVYTEALPRRWMTSVLVTLPPPPAPRPAATPPLVRVALRPVRQMELVQPVVIPPRVAILHEELLPPAPIIGYVNPEDAAAGHSAGNLLSEAIPVEPPPLPIVPQELLRMASNIVGAKLINQPKPVYPPLAIKTRTQGTVRLEAIIGKDGTIQNLVVRSGHPLLIRAALDAMRKWRYQPTLLNDVPVEVETTIDVNFILGS
ncbi:MAG: TonB family protein [Acidobacteria bacterium]|nr:TonB family protein [Acidobacteriota bacterium]